MSEAQTQSAPTVTQTSTGGTTASFSMTPSLGASKMDAAPTVAQMAAAKRAPTAPGTQPADLAPASGGGQSESHLSQDQLSAIYGDEEGGETAQPEGDQAELIMGRYKNTEELVEAYKNLQRHKGIEVPESYDLSDTGLKDTGISGLTQSDP